ncbi:serine--tRNA ligase [Striga asiatica]|uniref:Serine--tRNA ligase n=1 Tax=Striga asiatica TaxID=4170 RepID=A0A5A7QZA2_STRAF|nr:serine--tRNA ligase [Striga asiatica]
MQGTKVSAVAYNAVIDEFAELLMPYKRYYLTGAKVRPEVPLYQVGDYKYNWLINTRTYAEEYQEAIPPQLPCLIDVHAFANIHKYADTDNPRKYRNTDKLIPMPEVTDVNTVANALASIRYLPRRSHVEARCRLPVAIEDKTGTIYAIIYGADAEQLIPYNGNQLYEADQQSQHQVTCFIKYSEAAHHTIIKLYIGEMMIVQENIANPKSADKEPSTSTPSKKLYSLCSRKRGVSVPSGFGWIFPVCASVDSHLQPMCLLRHVSRSGDSIIEQAGDVERAKAYFDKAAKVDPNVWALTFWKRLSRELGTTMLCAMVLLMYNYSHQALRFVSKKLKAVLRTQIYKLPLTTHSTAQRF